jgi:LysM repeat protein
VTRIGALLLVSIVAVPMVSAFDSTSTTATLRGAAAVATSPAVVIAEPSIAATVTASSDSTSPTVTASSVSGTVELAAAGKSFVVPALPPTAPKSVEQVVTKSANCAQKYTIKPGDYWNGVAQRYGLPVKALLAANAARVSTALYAGRTLCLPAGATATTAVPVTTTAPTTIAAPVTTATVKPKVTATMEKPTSTKAAASSKAITSKTNTPPTTAPKTTTTTTTTMVPQRTYSRAEVIQIIRDVWPDDQEDKAIAIATRESNLVPGVRNYCCYGLFQLYYNVHQSWLGSLGVTIPAQLFDPRVNATAALALYNRSGGWGPWGG